MNLPKFRQGRSLVIPVILTIQNPPFLYDPPLPPTLSLEDPTGVIQLSNGVMVRDSMGFYHFTYVLANNAALGDWIGWVDATDGIYLSGTNKTFLFTATSE